jgi:hypothetical protein
MNEGGRTEATIEDLKRGLRLYLLACLLQAALVAAIAMH